MPDNLGYTPGTGARVATREVSYSGETANIQAVTLATTAGADDARTATDVSAANPLPVEAVGELVAAIEAMRFAVQSLTRSVGLLTVDTTGRLRMVSDSVTIAGTPSVAVASGTVTTVSTVTNQTQLGGQPANDHIPALLGVRADGLRANLTVT
jgi:hypothetical protein